eukprot:TRINITY_DN6553_c2_g1_i4.p1 TRINITY_DN6553_c2_g1~~TRINITY_DN6553_c2_g1_i4.p1  ORF type:complete len:309 (-),score=32.89 TRINITY_DN6553_c2_g1_i4:222-1148(-)
MYSDVRPSLDRLLFDDKYGYGSENSFYESLIVHHAPLLSPGTTECMTHGQFHNFNDCSAPVEHTAKVLDATQQSAGKAPSVNVFSSEFQDLGRVTDLSDLPSVRWLLDDSHEPHDDAGDAVVPSEWMGKTSVMIRNVPYKCTAEHLQKELCLRGFEGLFDYVYLPGHVGSKTCKGYAFVNFVDSSTALAFKNSCHGSTMHELRAKKLLEVIPANLQGLLDNASHQQITKDRQIQPGCASDVNPEFYGIHVVQADYRAVSQQATMMPPHVKQARTRNRPRARVVYSSCPSCGSPAPVQFRFCQCCGYQL